jgi:hypothetical protein
LQSSAARLRILKAMVAVEAAGSTIIGHGPGLVGQPVTEGNASRRLRGFRSRGRGRLGVANLAQHGEGALAVGQELIAPELLRLRGDDVREVGHIAVGELILELDGIGEQGFVLLLQSRHQFDQGGDEFDVGRGIGQVQHGLDLLNIEGGRRGRGGHFGGRCGGLNGLIHLHSPG